MSLKIVRVPFFLIGFCCLPCLIYAQQTLNINGTIYRKNASERIAQAIITNLKSNVIMMSDELGGFTIKASKGDTLLFNKKGYTPQTLIVAGPADIAVYLQPEINLPQVNIKEQSKRQELNDVVNTYRSKGLYFDGRPPWWLFNPLNGSPLTGFYELFSRDAKNERHFIKFSKNEMEAIAVNKRYNRQLVKQVTMLPDTDVTKFMQQYTPSYQDMQQWNDYELISHIKKYLQYYMKHKDGIPEQRLAH